jgi:hypothetical protein
MNLVEKILSLKPFLCPKCGKELPLADINMAQDAALCRACGYAGSFLGAASVPPMTDEELAHPPKRVSLQRDFGDALAITCRPKRTALLFLIPFTALWSGVSMAGIYIVPIAKGAFDLKLGLFGLPFLIGTVGFAIAILYTLFGATKVTLAKGRVRVFMGVFGLGRTREFECGKGTTVMIGKSGYRVNNVPQPEVVLTSGETKFKFGALGLSSEAQNYVAAVLRRAAGGG